MQQVSINDTLSNQCHCSVHYVNGSCVSVSYVMSATSTSVVSCQCQLCVPVFVVSVLVMLSQLCQCQLCVSVLAVSVLVMSSQLCQCQLCVSVLVIMCKLHWHSLFVTHQLSQC